MADCINIVRVISFQILRSRNDSVPVRDLNFIHVKKLSVSSRLSDITSVSGERSSFLAEKKTCFFS